MKNITRNLAILLCTVCGSTTFGQSANLGPFTDQSDVGAIGVPGPTTYDAATGRFIITGGGDNIWATNDAFHFVWIKMSGDLKLTADISFVGTNGNAHRKACLVIRQSLDPASVYADVALHGNGLTALQYRDATADATHEIQSQFSAPTRLEIEKRGDYISMSVAPVGGNRQTAGGYLRIPLTGDFYVGLAVCSHDNRTNAQAVFSNVQLTPLVTPEGVPTLVESTLETVPIASTDRQVIYRTTNHIEAPNWTRDGNFFLFNSQGHIFKLPKAGGTPEMIDTGDAGACNNDHGISPDGKSLAISASKPGRPSYVYTLPIEGGAPRQITTNGPSYWHGWSPDGKSLAFVLKLGNYYNIFSTPATGGPQIQLTDTKGTDDGPEYSPDGRYIYFNSDRTGSMQIWRMKPDGAGLEQITSDDYA